MADVKSVGELAGRLKETARDSLDPSKVFSARNLKKRRGAFWTCLIAALLLMLMAAAGAVYLNAVKVDRFEEALLQNVDYASLGTDEMSVRSFARETIFYLTGAQEGWNPQIVVGGFPASSFIPQSFRDHMATVKGWVSSGTSLFLAGAAIVLVLIGRALAGFGRSGKSGFSLKGYYLGAGVPLLLIAGVGLWASLDFNAMWAVLHQTLIPDGIFNAGELVMTLFPESVFFAYLPPIVETFLLFAAVVLLLPAALAPLSALVAKSRGRRSAPASGGRKSPERGASPRSGSRKSSAKKSSAANR